MNVKDDTILKHLQTLGMLLMSEWDTLAFLYTHSPSLGNATEIARLVGYDKVMIGAALQRLEVLALIERSRISQGIRLYRYAAPDPARHESVAHLMTVTQDRSGRLLLLKHLKGSDHAVRPNRDRGLRLA